MLPTTLKPFIYREIVKMATVNLRTGKIKGFITKTNPETVDVHTFKSVPIGKFKRFQKPEPFDSWDGVKDCTALTPRKVLIPLIFCKFNIQLGQNLGTTDKFKDNLKSLSIKRTRTTGFKTRAHCLLPSSRYPDKEPVKDFVKPNR